MEIAHTARFAATKPANANRRGSGRRGTFADYLAIARFDHATKHVFIVPGMALAYQLRGVRVESLAANAALGLVMAVCVASANYDINEWLDRDFDRYHPEKCKRSAVQRALHGPVVLAEWLALLMPGIVVLFSYYLALAMKPASSAQRPEKLFRERGLLAIVATISALFVTLTFVDIPLLEAFAKQRYIVIR